MGVYRELLLDSLAEAVGLTAAKLEKMLGSEAPGQKGIRTPAVARQLRGSKPVSGQPSVVRHAITILLNHPQAGLKADIERLASVSRKGTDLLQSLIETVQSEPNITTAGLLERFRHDEQGRHLGKLAANEVPMDDDFDAGAELADCLDQLALAGRKERIDFLIEKQRVSGLSDEEKTELRQLH